MRPSGQVHDIESSSHVPAIEDAGSIWPVIKTLKAEEVDGTRYRDRAEAARGIGTFIEEIYNGQRLHSGLGYRPPAEFEAWHEAARGPGVGDAARSGGSAPPTPAQPLDLTSLPVQPMD
jgi:hypothetical protein